MTPFVKDGSHPEGLGDNAEEIKDKGDSRTDRQEFWQP